LVSFGNPLTGGSDVCVGVGVGGFDVGGGVVGGGVVFVGGGVVDGGGVVGVVQCSTDPSTTPFATVKLHT
jgi:hypothetical protein